MKRPLIWKVVKNEFYILWIWRFSIVTASNFVDGEKYGVQIGKLSVLFWYKNYALGFGHSFGAEVEAYK